MIDMRVLESIHEGVTLGDTGDVRLSNNSRKTGKTGDGSVSSPTKDRERQGTVLCLDKMRNM